MREADTQPLTEAELAQDSHDCFYEYVRICREEREAGEPLPAMFVPRAGEREKAK